MSIGPILPGRIPGSLAADRLRQNLEIANRRLAYLQDQVASGQRFFRPGEDPSAAIRTIILQKTIERKTQLKANVAVDRSLLNASELALSSVGDSLNQAKSLLLAGTGSAASPAEKQAMAIEVAAIIQNVLTNANTNVRGRYLFGGSQSQQTPFELTASGTIRYNGDRLGIQSYIDTDLLLANNVDGATAFGALTEPVGSDIDPALTLATKITDLLGGEGVQLGEIVVTVDTGGGPVSATIDLSGAKTVGDIKTLIENSFGPGDVTVSIVAGPPQNGIRLTPSAGTVAVADAPGSKVATHLGIVSAAAAAINGADLNPRLTLGTPLSALNGGAGVTTANGLLITNGSIQKAVDLSSAVTVEDLFNVIRAENLELDLGINDAGNGLSISSRLSGASFSIGENGGGDAASLGIRTFDGTTLLSDLNLGRGVPVNRLDADGNLLPAPLEITRRDGTTVSIDLKGLSTVQQVLDAINAVDPGQLVASLNAVGNGITILDNDGSSTGPLIIPDSEISVALGVNGTESGTNATVPLVGREVNPRQSEGIFTILLALQKALSSGDDAELARLDPLITREIERFNLVRGEVGSRLKVLDQVENRLLDEDVTLQQSLSDEFDVDMTEAITQIAQMTAALQATLKIAAETFQTSLFDFL